MAAMRTLFNIINCKKNSKFAGPFCLVLFNGLRQNNDKMVLEMERY